MKRSKLLYNWQRTLKERFLHIPYPLKLSISFVEEYLRGLSMNALITNTNKSTGRKMQKKRRNKEEGKGNQEKNLTAVALLNRETKRKIMIIIDKQGRLEVVDDEKSQNQQASDNVVEDAHITSAKARSLQLAVKQERENSQPEDLVKPNYQESQDIKFNRDKTKCPEQINQQDYQEWSKTKIFELKGNAIPLRLTLSTSKTKREKAENDINNININNNVVEMIR